MIFVYQEGNFNTRNYLITDETVAEGGRAGGEVFLGENLEVNRKLYR